MSTNANAVETITLNVAGMTCGSCERHIRNELNEVRGYSDAEVDLAGGKVHVTYQAGAATPEQLVSAVVKAGYPAEVARASTQARSSGPKSGGCCAARSS